MKSTIGIVSILFSFITPTQAQYVAEGIKTDSVLTTGSTWRMLFFLPGIAYETRIGRKTTVATDLRMTGYYEYSSIKASTGSSSGSRYAIYPNLTVGIRQYYNLARRLARGKTIKANSGNYLSLRGIYIFPSVLERQTTGVIFLGSKPKTNIAAVALLWGLQRTYRRNLYLNLNVGAIISDRYKNGYNYTGDFMLGYSFFAR